MNLAVPVQKPRPVPQGTVVLAPSYCIVALATGLSVEVRARPIRRLPPCS
ncbi:MAG: hypothetical protein ACYC8T_05380 [Myxococcaceae bacterium]